MIKLVLKYILIGSAAVVIMDLLKTFKNIGEVTRG